MRQMSAPRKGGNMLSYLQDFYKKLIITVLQPIADRIFKLPWSARFLIVLLLAAGCALAQRPEIMRDLVSYSGRFARVLVADADTIALAKPVRDRVTRARNRLMLANTNDIHLIDTDGLTGWSAAQTLLSIGQPGKASEHDIKLINHIRARQLPACHCWAELNDESEKKAWTFISGWVMAALASKGVPATDSELGFLLNQQNPDGSWSSIPRKELDEFKSVSATSWAVIGLRKLLDAKLIAKPELAARASGAVQRGAVWLMRTRQANARWKPYPELGSSTISVSISGLAMHALHLSGHGDMTDFDKEWLDHLPASPVPASLAETYYVEIKRGGTLQIDHFMYLNMPWTLIATTDAYHNGGIFQKTRALTWMEETLLHDSVKNADAEQGNWWRAELLIAINHLHEAMDRKSK